MELVLDASLIYWVLLVIGGFFFIMQLKLMLRPQFRGEIIEFEQLDEQSCQKCKSTKKGRMSQEVTVLNDDGDLIKVEISCCMICLDRLQVGSIVGVTKIGTRLIAQPIISLRHKPRIGVTRS